MKKIASFQINHDTLIPGLYISRVDGDAVTYDLRMKYPNQGDYLANAALHEQYGLTDDLLSLFRREVTEQGIGKAIVTLQSTIDLTKDIPEVTDVKFAQTFTPNEIYKSA